MTLPFFSVKKGGLSHEKNHNTSLHFLFSFHVAASGLKENVVNAVETQSKDIDIKGIKKSINEVDQKIGINVNSPGNDTGIEKHAARQERQIPDKLVCRFVELNPKKISRPCTLTISPQCSSKKTVVFRFPVVQHNVIEIKVGMASSTLKQLKYSIYGTIITAEESEESSFKVKEKLFFMLNFHLPRDQARYKPCPFQLWKNFSKRLGLFVGLKLSADPLESIFVGLSFLLTRHIDFVSGLSIHNEVKPSTVNIENISSL